MGEFSYEQLFDIVRRERAREQLQDLEEGFYEQAQAYQEDLESQVRQKDALDPQADTIRTQLVNSKKLLRELYDRREKKILHLALNKARTNSNLIDTSSLISRERPLFEELESSLKSHRISLNLHAPNKPSPTPTPRQVNKPVESKKPVDDTPKMNAGEIRVRVTASVPKFLGANGETHGPYEEGSEVFLPERIARILIRKGRAENA